MNNIDIADNLFQLDEEISRISEHDKISELLNEANKSFFNNNIKIYINLINDLATPLDLTNLKYDNVGNIIIIVKIIYDKEYEQSFITKLMSELNKAKKHANQIIKKMKDELNLEQRKVKIKFVPEI